MSVDSDFAAVGMAPDEGNGLFADHPSYMIAADMHTIGNNQGSMLDLTTWGDKASNLTEGALAVAARAVTSAWNTVPEVGNFLGGDFDSVKLDTEQVLRGFDDNLGDYYVAHKQGIDITGDVIGAFAPGLGGIKMLNWGQRALKLIPEGNFGYNIARSIGTLPDKQAEFAKVGAEMAAQTSGTFSWVNAAVIKSVSAGYAQQALEFGAFQAAAASTMRSSPLFDTETPTDILYNSILGGGVIGGGIMGSIAAARTLGLVKRAGIATDAALASSRTVNEAAMVSTPADKIIVAHVGIDQLPEIAADDPQAALKAQVQTKTVRTQNNIVRTNAIAMSSDAELGNTLADLLHGTDAPTVLQNMLGNTEAGRIGTTLEAEKEFNAATALNNKAVAAAAKVRTVYQAPAVTPVAIRYMPLFGEGAGTMQSTRPMVTYIGDNAKNSAAVDDVVRGYKFNLTKEFNPLADDVDHTTMEARTIFLDKAKLPDMEKLAVDSNDIPLLERLYSDGLPATLTDGRVIGVRDMQKYLTDTKIRVSKIIMGARDLLPDSTPMSTEEAAKFVNIKQSLLEGEVNTKTPMSDYLAMQSARQDASNLARAKGVSLDPGYVVDTYHAPQYAKFSYDPEVIAANTLDDRLIDGITYAKQLHAINQASSDVVAAKYLGEFAPNFQGLFSDAKLATANRMGVGAKIFAQSDGGYMGVAADAEYCGQQTHTLIQRQIGAINDRFTGHFYKFGANDQLGMELATLRQNMLSTPEKYILNQTEEGDWEVANRKLVEWQEGVAPEVDTRIATNIPVSDDMADFLRDWVAHNDEQLNHRYSLLTAQGKQYKDLTGNLYFPQPNPRDYPHFAMVFDPQVTGTGHKAMITAADETTLQQQVAKVQAQNPEFTVLYKSEIAARKRAEDAYDFDQGINDNYVDAELKRAGVAPFFAKTDPAALVQELAQWRIGADTNLARDMVALKNERAFKALQRMGQQETLEATSTFGAASTRKYAQDTVADPYNNYVKTALDISTASEYKRWKAVNDFAENAFSGVVQKVVDMWKDVKTPADLEPINAALKEAGINTNFEDSMTMAYANHTAPKPYLSQFIRGANSILSTLMLKGDPGNAANNALGNTVLTGAETVDLINRIKNSQLFGDLATIKAPGTGDSVISPMKLIGGAYQDWFKMMAGNPELQNTRDFYKSNGWMMDMHDEVKNMLETATLSGTETPEMLYGKTQSNIAAMGKFLSKWTGNNYAEQMNRFVAARIGQKISDIGVSTGALTESDQRAFINSFVNRSQGNYLASQRPIAFQGPIGQAVGLFQTYQFNMMNHIYRRVEAGNNKNLAVLLGLQGSMYGFNGLPAINAINDHLIGNAAGNTNHSDIYSTVPNLIGKDAGDWLTYGFASNFLLHPDLKTNLYSRGDINPRSVTVIPTTLADVPIVSAAASTFGALKSAAERIGAGGNVYTSVLQGIEHAGLNRPLAGLATVLEGAGNGGTGYSTTTQGQLVMATDILSLSNLARIAGAKPLDEAVARDAMYRTKVYAADRTQQIETLGAAIKGKLMQGDTPSADDMNNFLAEYVKAGGSQNNFNKFIGKLSMQAKTSQVNVMAQNLKNPSAQYMQKVLGGYTLEDMTNTPGGQ